jgi:sirohydrochlorin ferrochelatase
LSTGIIVFAHGSRVEAANEAVRSAAEALARLGEHPLVEAAFLELAHPTLEEAADDLVARGVERIIVIPYFLTPGLHLERDLPSLAARISNKYSDIDITVTASLDGHAGLVEILSDRARGN